MLSLIHVTVLSVFMTAGSPAGVACSGQFSSDDGHLSDVCSEWLEGGPAYSATMRASLSPRPASQQVMLFQMDGDWFMRVAGYRWEPESAVETRRREFPISNDDAQVIIDRLTIAHLQRLGELYYYGSTDVICTDGASFEVAMAIDGQKFSARQHSCAGKTQLHQTAALFRRIALEYDPEFSGMLTGLDY